jgi:hypothetical protein
VTKRSYRRPPGGFKPEQQLPRISMQSGPKPVAPDGYGCIPADAETLALLGLREGLQAQAQELDDYIVSRLEAKLAARRR